MADLLRFVHVLATDAELRDGFRRDPLARLTADVDGADELTGEDVEAAVESARTRIGRRQRPQLRLAGPARPLGDETPAEAAVRLLVDLCDQLDGPAARLAALPHRDQVPDPPPSTVATGGGEPVPTEPPGGRWLHPVIPDDGGGDPTG